MATAVALTATAVAVSPAPASAAEGQPPDAIGIRLLDAPVERRDDPRARRAIIDHVQPGDTIQRRVFVLNTYDFTYDVPMYVEAAEVSETSFTPVGKDADPGPLTEWSLVSPSPLPLGPQESGEVTVTIRVPDDAAHGEYYGLIFAESPAGDGDVQVVNRVGVRIYLSVGEGLEPPSDFEVDSLVAVRNEAGEPEVRVNVTNTGQRALDLQGELTLSDGPGGLSAGPFSAQGTTTLGISRAGEMFVPLDASLPDGPWLATFVARSGPVERTVESVITFPAGDGEVADPAAAAETRAVGGDADGDGVNDDLERQRRTLLPIAALLILLAIAGLFLLLWWQRREQDEDEESTVPAGVGRDDS